MLEVFINFLPEYSLPGVCLVAGNMVLFFEEKYSILGNNKNNIFVLEKNKQKIPFIIQVAFDVKRRKVELLRKVIVISVNWSPAGFGNSARRDKNIFI